MEQYQRIQIDAIVFARDELMLLGFNLDRLSEGKVGMTTSNNYTVSEISVYFTDKHLHYRVLMAVENNQDISLKSVLIQPLHLVPGFGPKAEAL